MSLFFNCNSLLREEFHADKCVICCEDNGEVLASVRDKGAISLLDASSARECTGLVEYLHTSPSQILVHVSCRKRYTDARQLKKCRYDSTALECSLNRSLRSNSAPFNWKDMCLFCVEKVDDTGDVRQVMTLELKGNIIKHCDIRQDEWSLEVRGRLESVIDLPAAEAVYHKTCLTRFKRKNDKPNEEPCVPDWRIDADKSSAFDNLCDWLEGSCDKLYSLDELHDQMALSANCEIYSKTHLKRKLSERYGTHIIFAEMCGRKNVVCFQDMCSFILSEKWYGDRKLDIVAESERLVTSAAKLIVTQIRELKCDISTYHTNYEITNHDNSFVPPLLRTLMQILVPAKMKQAALSQCIVQSARPRSVIAPIPFGLAIQLDNNFGSKFLIQNLFRLGMSVSYDEVIRYKQSVVVSHTPGHASNVPYPPAFTQWVADNVDHNVRTLDGYGSFHGMGIISASMTSSIKPEMHGEPVSRLSKRLLSAQIVKNRGVQIVQYHGAATSWLMNFSYDPLVQLQQPVDFSHLSNLTLLWHAGWFSSSVVRSNWSGFMQSVCKGDHGSAAVIQFLPMIDHNPSDETCIYSTLLHVIDQAQQLHIETPCITFDMPLWLKAVDISKTANLNIVCKLGGFHTIMSFLGSIGHMMAGSGLEDIFRLGYGPDTVRHIMSGKAVSRAIRAHFLVESALTVTLLSSELANEFDLDAVLSLYEATRTNGIWLTGDCAILSDPALQTMCEKINELFTYLSVRSRTAKLWIQYMRYVGVLKLFIAAERTGNWHLHLKCIHDMLNLFAATGHNNYAKGGRLYLQLMSALPVKHEWLYNMFVEHGFHVIRRSDRFWGGLSSDLVIEQTLIKSAKSRSGLTRGRGMDEGVRSVWVSSMHECANVHLAMSSMTGTNPTNPDHVDVGATPATRDQKDLVKVMDYLEVNSPFSYNDSRLRSLSSGATACDRDGVNCDDAEEIGSKIMRALDGVKWSDIHLKRSNQMKTLLTLQKQCSIGKKPLNIDSSTLFHSLIILVERSADIPKFFEYELTPIPSALFKDGLMRKADKASLAKHLINGLSCNELPSVLSFVIDGGYLLRRVKWPKICTYGDIVNQYIAYLQRRFCRGAVIVFDGYEGGPSTKDHEHNRRMLKVKVTSPDVFLDESKTVLFDQQAFLANTSNKDRLIKLLRRRFLDEGFVTSQSYGDADVDIVSSAIDIAKQQRCVAVVGEDTEVLVMLAAHWTTAMADVWFLSHRKSKLGNDQKICQIRELQGKLGSEICQLLPAIHALGGCDTTSSLFGIGKSKIFNKITTDRSAWALTQTLQNSIATSEEVIVNGSKLIVSLYGGRPGESLNKMRYAAYCKTASSSLVRPQPERLPPTERSSVFHLLRVHHQATVWNTLNADVLDPLQWGWKEEEGQLSPIMNDLAPAPNELLKVVRCKCKAGCKSESCSCRKHGLKCVSACSHCNGLDCANVESAREISEGEHCLSGSESEEECTEPVSCDTSQLRDIMFDSDIDWTVEEVVIDTLDDVSVAKYNRSTTTLFCPSMIVLLLIKFVSFISNQGTLSVYIVSNLFNRPRNLVLCILHGFFDTREQLVKQFFFQQLHENILSKGFLTVYRTAK